MSVSYDLFTGAFLAKISEFEFLQLPAADRTNLVDGYMKRAVAEFKHICVNEDRKIPNNAFLIISGLSAVNDRIAKINDRIAEIQEAQKRQEDDDEIDLDIINSVNEKRVYAKNAVEPQQIDIQSLFSKFDVNME